jgi:hypothetical protein
MLEKFTKAAVVAESMLLQMKEIKTLSDMISFVLGTAPSIPDNDANPYITAVGAKIDELRLLPEDRKTVIGVIADRALSQNLINLAAEDMRQNVKSPEAKESWQQLIGPRR